MILAPIALFVYRRPEHTRQTLEALSANELASESDLFIFSDGARNDEDAKLVGQVRDYIGRLEGFNSITLVKRDKNWGLANSIIDGVTQVVNQYGKIIVLEDDIITSPYFLKYMNDALNLYENEEKVASVNAYMYPIEGLPETFFLRAADCWGWGTWQRAWELFNPGGTELLTKITENNLVDVFNFYGSYSCLSMLKDQIKGENDSWAIRWSASVLVQDRLGLYVGKSMAWNIGFDGSGFHNDKADLRLLGLPVPRQKIKLHAIPLLEDKNSAVLIGKYLSKIWAPKNILIRSVKKLLRIVSGKK